MKAMNAKGLHALRIGVLCGGDSPERIGSLASGKAASQALSQAGYRVQLVDLAEVAVYDLDGQIDVALLALHGLGGEDGKIQGTLDTLGLPYTGSGVMASAIAMHKATCKELVQVHRMDTPAWRIIKPGAATDDAVQAIGASLGFPAFLKPISGGGSLAARLVRDEDDLRESMLGLPIDMYGEYLIEEYVPGTPCTVGVLEVDEALSVLPVHDVETDRDFYDYTAKHDREQRQEHCPSILPDAVTGRLQQYALRAHRLIGAHGVSRVDFIVAPTGRTPLLEMNTVPGLSEFGNLATMARAGGYDYTDLVVRILQTAFTKPAYLP